MAGREDEDLQRALQMSLQHAAPEPKRIKPRESVGVSDGPPGESLEAKNRRLQREILAAAAEKRISLGKSNQHAQNVQKNAAPPAAATQRIQVVSSGGEIKGDGVRVSNLGFGEDLSPEDAHQLYSMLFGSSVSRDILAQWCNQGIRFSSDPETCMGLVQHEGGPCGVLAAIQAFLLKKLLFFPESGDITASRTPQHLGPRRSSQSVFATLGNFASLTESGKTRALVLTMGEMLFSCGSKKRAVIATLSVLGHHPEDGFEDVQRDEMIAKALEGLSIESGSDLQKVLRVNTYTSQASVLHHLKAMLPVFQSRMGVMLFLISALLSRGPESIQADRDDPGLPLVTTPFGHASQEIVNLLLCGQAVPNVFDGRMDLGGGMFLKGIPTSVEVGFLTLLESLNFCKVGQNLKCPKWPIWVVGSESHYTVLFALDTSVQDENELEQRESQIRKSFDAQDQSGGGGFISSDGLQIVLKQANINFPPDKLESLCSTGFIVWSEFWQALLELDKTLGGLKDSTGLMGKKQFDLYHFNGIAKSVSNGSLATTGGESPQQRPRLSKLRVLVPPKWTPEEFMTNVASSSSNDPSAKQGIEEVNQPEPSQHAPLVDCIRTRWSRAICSWIGDPPSIV